MRYPIADVNRVLLVSLRGEKIAGRFVVGAILFSGCVSFVASLDRLLDPQHLTHVGALAGAYGGVVALLAMR